MNDPNCIFCKIVKGQIPADVIYEDADFLAFLDIHPQSPGHAQVIPKEHHRWVWDYPEAGKYFEVAKSIAAAQRAAFETDWILSKIVGDEVPHAHIWVFPNSNVKGDKNNFKLNAEMVRAHLKTPKNKKEPKK
jgi:histidine triad (HIT) family protein